MIRIVLCLLLALACVQQVDAHGGVFFGFNRGRSSAFISSNRVFVQQRQPFFGSSSRVFVQRQFSPRFYGGSSAVFVQPGFNAAFVRPGFSAGFSAGGFHGGSAAFFSFRR